ncbi:MAG: hypothetical protein NC395_11635, partial [Prevotella sp.]|nr:hypothetical protein [Prevotella sp.]
RHSSPSSPFREDLRPTGAGNFAPCGERPGALPRGPRSLERLANFLVAASPRDALLFCFALNNNLQHIIAAKENFNAKQGNNAFNEKTVFRSLEKTNRLYAI